MKILGAEHMLKEKAPKVILGWNIDGYDKINKFLEYKDEKSLNQELVQEIIDIIEEYLESGYVEKEELFSVWVGDNYCQFDFTDGTLDDINIMGDASPKTTLYFVFDDEELEIIDKFFDTKIEDLLTYNWNRIIELSKSEYDNSWCFEELEKSYYNDCRKVIECDIEFDFIRHLLLYVFTLLKNN